MTVARLDRVLLRDLPPVPAGARKVRIADDRLPGFGLEISVGGAATYRLRYRTQRGRVRDIKLGRHPELTPDEARKLALVLKADVWRGFDPAAERDRLRAIPTFKAFVEERFLPHVRQTLRSHAESASLMRLRVVPAFGRFQLDEVTPLDVARFRQKLIDEGLSASRVNAHLAVLRRAFNLAIKWGLLEGRNPAASPEMLRTEGREHYLDAAQVKALLLALAADPDRAAASAVALLVLTGARKSEVLEARWSYVDLDRRILWVPRSKSGRRRSIFLSAPAVQVLRLQSRKAGEAYIFPSPRIEGQPLSGLRGVWERAKVAAGLPGATRLHDLRHTFASLLVNDGVPIYDIGRLLGHTQLSTTARYAHLNPQTQLRAVEALGRLTALGARDGNPHATPSDNFVQGAA